MISKTTPTSTTYSSKTNNNTLGSEIKKDFNLGEAIYSNGFFSYLVKEDSKLYPSIERNFRLTKINEVLLSSRLNLDSLNSTNIKLEFIHTLDGSKKTIFYKPDQLSYFENSTKKVKYALDNPTKNIGSQIKTNPIVLTPPLSLPKTFIPQSMLSEENSYCFIEERRRSSTSIKFYSDKQLSDKELEEANNKHMQEIKEKIKNTQSQFDGNFLISKTESYTEYKINDKVILKDIHNNPPKPEKELFKSNGHCGTLMEKNDHSLIIKFNFENNNITPEAAKNLAEFMYIIFTKQMNGKLLNTWFNPTLIINNRESIQNKINGIPLQARNHENLEKTKLNKETIIGHIIEKELKITSYTKSDHQYKKAEDLFNLRLNNLNKAIGEVRKYGFEIDDHYDHNIMYNNDTKEFIRIDLDGNINKI